eukprot:CAMPEP_0168732644 /NCGR_PEP_ID=MMETSP0724-20121128/7875_1 /TAXON_ID=265536 /ORGANISM="Amphiprora sp., Strain CCMP467" /LENGTH=251 /DNA_ID=CAMNT_0008779665 /DNA_START=53 /DNA_END=808 /DNA_ORIENTATION=+
MKTAVFATLLASAAAFAPSANKAPSTTVVGETKADLESLAADLNPIVKFFDPLNLAGAAFWGTSDEKTIGWLRHSEIKHGRVAMAAFVGYCVQSNFVLPYALTLDGTPHPSTSLSPPEQWDALPFASKLQIIAFVGFLEFYSELTPVSGATSALPHYMSGGVPGKFPTFDDIPHPMPFNSLYDPFKLSKNKSEDSKAKGLKAEINNGRLAMLGIFGFLCEQTIPGSVPLLTGVVKPYSGEVMAPFEGNLFL